MLCITLVSCSQTQPSAMWWEGSGLPTFVNLVIEFITVVMIFLQLAYWESMNILILVMNIISSWSATKIAKHLAKLLINANTVDWPEPSRRVAEGWVWLWETTMTYHDITSAHPHKDPSFNSLSGYIHLDIPLLFISSW